MVLESSSAYSLGISLVCTKCTRAADMLAHSPALPLAIDYLEEYGITLEDEEEAILKLLST